ncbi:acyltransferase family protein [Spirosoma agri]|uniref:Acyltransferase n=1 Tax=Spirosoma agri TaxID=1987381 RepID=A0A6M0ILW6_9BACT|nr:acyltransferase [Spirosoma agri]NEU69320.1 acyltransferase [Spirosoma agri]
MQNSYTPESTAVSQDGHLRFLDGLRAVAAVFVVIHHQQQPLPTGDKPLLLQLLYRFFFHGHYAVDLFIVLSGFCLMLPALRNNNQLVSNSPLLFFRKRAQRILPPYFLAMALSLLLISTVIGQKTGTRWDASIPVLPFDLFTHVLMIHDIFTSTAPKINGVFWSIAVEWRIYLVFPLLLLLWRRLGGFTTTLLTTTLSLLVWHVLSVMQLPDINLTQWGLCPHYLGLFTMGMMAAYIAYSPSPLCAVIQKKTPWLLLTTVFGVSILLATRFDTLLPWVYTDVLVGLGSVCLLVALKTGRFGRLKAWLSWQPLVLIGTFSYSIYLIHMPILQVIQQYLIFPLNLDALGTTLYLLFIGTALVICLSYLFYLLAERPFIPKKKTTYQQVSSISVS